MAPELRFADTVRDVTAAAESFINGDPEPYKAHWSRTEDVTIFGGFGSGERGWHQVGPRLDWAAARFQSGELSCEPLAAGHSGDLGYAVGIERGHATVVGRDEPGELALRVTHLFRRESGQWKLIHRHADAITAVLAPDELLHDPTGDPTRHG
jgi:ketosteroid isomerase-like protein